MRFRIMSVFALGLLTSSYAYADSFCGFEQGLIGTKAIGMVMPSSLELETYETGKCEIKAFDAPSGDKGPTVLPCTDFQHVPSVYIDGYETKGFDPVGSEYFWFLVFNARDQWVEIALKSGEKKWTLLESQHDAEFDYQYLPGKEIKLFAQNPTQGMMFSEPRLDKPVGYMGQFLRGISDDWIDQAIPHDFFNNEVFQILADNGGFDPNHIEEGKLATHYGKFLHVAYDVKTIIRDDEGREWLKAEEFLTISYMDFWDYVEIDLAALGKPLSEEDLRKINNSELMLDFRSKAGRTVYFPYREPSGTITMVMTSGPDCD